MEGRKRYEVSFTVCTFLLFLSLFFIYISHFSDEKEKLLDPITVLGFSILCFIVLLAYFIDMLYRFYNELDIRYTDNISLYRRPSTYDQIPTKKYWIQPSIENNTDSNGKRITCFFNAEY